MLPSVREGQNFRATYRSFEKWGDAFFTTIDLPSRSHGKNSYNQVLHLYMSCYPWMYSCDEGRRKRGVI